MNRQYVTNPYPIPNSIGQTATGQVPTWNASTGQWEAKNPAVSALLTYPFIDTACLLSNNALSSMVSNNSAITIRNCAIVGNGGATYRAFDTLNGGTIDYDYCLITGNNYLPENNITGTTGLTDGGHNVVEGNPGFVAYPYSAYFNISLDDADTTYWRAVADVVNPLGVKITCFVTPSLITTQDEINDLIYLANQGNEVAIHDWSHTGLNQTTAFTVTTTNANPTINVNVAAKILTLGTTTGGNTVTVDWSVTDKTIADLKTAVTGKGWTITNDTVYIYDAMKLSSLADTSGAVAVPHDCALDIVAPNYQFWEDEVTATQDWITTNVGVEPTTMSYPNGLTSAGLEAWIRDNTNIIGARGTGSNFYLLSSLDIYNVKANNSDLGLTEATARANARHVGAFSQTVGALYCMYSHHADQVTTAQWGYYVEEIKRMGGVFYTFKEIITAIRADHATADGLTYTKSYTNNSNYKIRPNSASINTGTPIVGITTDFIGNHVPSGGAFDIGPYEYQNSFAIMF